MDPADVGLLERIFQVLADRGLDPALLEAAKATVREEFGGQSVYVNRRDHVARQQLQDAVLSAAATMTATQLAHELGISRATVYRILKQAGRR